MALIAALQITELLAKIKPLAKAVEGVQKLAGKIGIGGVKDARFIAKRDKVFSLFKDAGYGAHDDPKWAPLVGADGIGHAQVPDRKTAGNYQAEFNNLRKYIVDRLNGGNPGLGTVWGAYFPVIPMINLGDATHEPFESLELILKTFKPGTYEGGSIPMPDTSVTQPYANTPDLAKSKLAAGVERATPSVSIAGFNNMTIIVIVILLALGAWFYSDK